MTTNAEKYTSGLEKGLVSNAKGLLNFVNGVLNGREGFAHRTLDVPLRFAGVDRGMLDGIETTCASCGDDDTALA
jgi:hypothetical protein